MWNNYAVAGVLLSSALLPSLAGASLGDPAASVQSDLARLHGSLNVVDHENYRVHELRLPTGTAVREFSDLDGTVFAVAWSGPTIPNLRQTLGQYFDRYVAAAKAPHPSHRHLQVRDDDLVIQAGGHMRAFSGRAYLPHLVPGGVNIGDLR